MTNNATGLAGALLLTLAATGLAHAAPPAKDATGEIVVWDYQPAGSASEKALFDTAKLFDHARSGAFRFGAKRQRRRRRLAPARTAPGRHDAQG